MAKRKKKNNIIEKRGNYYYRCRWYNEFGRQVETTIPLNTDNRNTALHLGKKVDKHIDDIKSGVIQKYQFKTYFEWLNDEGTSTLKKLTFKDIIPKYLEFKQSKKREKKFGSNIIYI